MAKDINQTLKHSRSTGRGVDIASKRADDLDKLCLERIQEKNSPKVLDVGSGLGGQSVRMVQAGALVTAVDIHDFAEQYASLSQVHNFSTEQLHFTHSDITKLQFSEDAQFSDILMQRVLHYLPHQSAQILLKKLHTLCNDSLYISVTGMNSAIATNYFGRRIPLNERFVSLTPEDALTFSIHEPVCLYTQVEFKQLLFGAGWKMQYCWESAFGNLKAVCTR